MSTPTTRPARLLRAATALAVGAALSAGLLAGPADARDGRASVTAGRTAVVRVDPARTAAPVTTAPVTSTPVPGRPGGPLVPDAGVLLGVYTSAGWAGTTAAMKRVAAREALVGRSFAIDHHFYAWGDSIPSGMEQADLAAGRVPLATWEPTQGLDVILDGSQDTLIRKRAATVAALGRPIMIRFGHEMNGDWYVWGGARSSTPGTTDGPAKFVAAWRRVHDLFVQAGATNAVWVWSPNWVSIPTQPWNAFTAYYPGDAYVDWVGVDGYNWGTQRPGGWRALGPMLQPVYDAYAARKPVMVAETSSTEVGGDKAAWVAQTAATLQRDFPAVAALVWFDQDKGDVDWRLDSSAASLTAFRALAANPWFTPRAGVTAPALVPANRLTVAPYGDRSAESPLAGRTLSGLVHVRAHPVNGVDQVAFHLDDPLRRNAPRRVDTWAPYDLVDGTATSALDTSTLSPGAHTLTVASTVAGWTEVTTVAFTVAQPTAVPAAQVKVSLSADRTSPLTLSGRTLAGRVYVTAYPLRPVTRVRFHLDDPLRARAPLGDEYGAPWDLRGGTASAAVAWDVSALAAGRHTLTVVATLADGTVEATTVPFTR